MNAHLVKLKEEMEEVMKANQRVAEHVKAESRELKAAVEKLKEVSGGGGSMLFPLAVCAQALVVAALLFYATAGGGKRHSHLP